jgi:hypothetical protein
MVSGTPRVAIVHEWLITYAGSEKVLEAMLEVFPDADIFCALDFLPERFRGGLKNKKIRTSFIQQIPFARHLHRYLLALMPLAVEQHRPNNPQPLRTPQSRCVKEGAQRRQKPRAIKLLRPRWRRSRLTMKVRRLRRIL